MAEIIAGLNEHHAHAGSSAYVERIIDEGPANPLPLMGRIHGQDIHLAHAVLRMQSSTYPAHKLITFKSDRYIPGLIIKNSRHVAVLAYLPSQWVEDLVNEAGHRVADQGKHRFPG